MLIKILTTLAIVGSSSVALADHPTARRDARQVVYRDRDGLADRRIDRDERRFARRDDRRDDRRFARGLRERTASQTYAARTSWLALTPQLRQIRGAIIADLDLRERFGQLRLQNQHGRTVVQQIEIEFADGGRQIVDGRHRLEGNHAMINIDLDGGARRIARVIVHGHSTPGASYQLYAM